MGLVWGIHRHILRIFIGKVGCIEYHRVSEAGLARNLGGSFRWDILQHGRHVPVDVGNLVYSTAASAALVKGIVGDIFLEQIGLGCDGLIL